MLRRTRHLVLALLVLLALVATACGSDDGPSASASTTLSLVAYSVPKPANNAVEAAFAETDAGKGVTWQESYGASGDQSRSVVNGLHADYVHFSLEGDVTRLVDEGLVADDWNAGPTRPCSISQLRRWPSSQ